MKYYVFYILIIYHMFNILGIGWSLDPLHFFIPYSLLLYKCCHMPDVGQSSKLGKCESWENASLAL